MATADRAAVEKKLCPVCERVLDRIRIEILVDIVAAEMTPAQRLRFDRPRVFHPATFVDPMNVIIAEQPTARPNETVEALDLIHQVRDVLRPRLREGGRNWSMHAIPAHHDDLPDFAAPDAIVQFAARTAMPHHEPDADLHSLLVRFLSQFEHAPA